MTGWVTGYQRENHWSPNIVFINLEIQTHLPWLDFEGGGGENLMMRCWGVFGWLVWFGFFLTIMVFI